MLLVEPMATVRDVVSFLTSRLHDLAVRLAQASAAAAAAAAKPAKEGKDGKDKDGERGERERERERQRERLKEAASRAAGAAYGYTPSDGPPRYYSRWVPLLRGGGLCPLSIRCPSS